MNKFEVPAETGAVILAARDKFKTSFAAIQLITDDYQRSMAARHAAVAGMGIKVIHRGRS